MNVKFSVYPLLIWNLSWQILKSLHHRIACKSFDIKSTVSKTFSYLIYVNKCLIFKTLFVWLSHFLYTLYTFSHNWQLCSYILFINVMPQQSRVEFRNLFSAERVHCGNLKGILLLECFGIGKRREFTSRVKTLLSN